ncbi:tyrosine-type recombinase/integrase [Sediminibacterium soli]|uniref:tyrosine-type recombinase/integrase n=1 Tax=Sediminibacterium soli TaxID=2698829 RepID=UPI00137B571C|nr:tyrosine-type recombinase/integrase [Sediminibacterium soli]NCI45663.1 tyrosine-type recombinase/integrase [Sediminibacterium soli]
MKQLPLQSPSYAYAERGFREWLDILGYAPTTIYNLPNAVRELFHWMEGKGWTQLHQITSINITDYYDHLRERENITRGGGLSNAYLNKHRQAINLFANYLRQSGKLALPIMEWENEGTIREQIDVLTIEEVKLLYQSADHFPEQQKHQKGREFYEALQYRDKAMLSVYYSCGLRRNEGVMLDTGDINFDRGLLHVRKGKNYKERFVPITKQSLQHLQTYLYDARPLLLKAARSHALFISAKAQRINGQTMLVRLKYLIGLTDNARLQQKQVGLHTLRHSIATHLLAKGMELERIKDFLGHTSLESTQIYTHLKEE